MTQRSGWLLAALPLGTCFALLLVDDAAGHSRHRCATFPVSLSV
jgi:hypothetical protein